MATRDEKAVQRNQTASKPNKTQQKGRQMHQNSQWAQQNSTGATKQPKGTTKGRRDTAQGNTGAANIKDNTATHYGKKDQAKLAQHIAEQPPRHIAKMKQRGTTGHNGKADWAPSKPGIKHDKLGINSTTTSVYIRNGSCMDQQENARTSANKHAAA